MTNNWKSVEELLQKEIIDPELIGDVKASKLKDEQVPYETIFEIEDEKIKKILEVSDSLRDNYDRDRRYTRLGEIQEDPEFNGMLKIYADEANTLDEDGKKINVFCSSQRVVEIVKRAYERIGLENKSWEIIKNMCGFGDEFYELVYAKDFSRILKMIKLPRNLMERVESRGELKHFKVRQDYTPLQKNEQGINQVEFEYQRFLQNLNKEETIIKPYRVLHFKIDSDKNYPHGESIFEGMISAVEEYRLMRQAMLINRITRAPERRIYRINVGNLTGERGMEFARKIIDDFKKKKVIDKVNPNNKTQKERNHLSPSEDIVIPYRQGEEAHSVDTLPGINVTPTEDTEFFRDRIYPGVGITRSYLYDDTLQNTNMNLSNKDIKFARKIQRVQAFFIYQCYKIALIELRLNKIPKKEYQDLIITMNNPSTLLEEQRVSIQTAKWGLVQTIKQNNTDTAVFVNDFYIYENILGMSKEEILKFMLLNKAQEKKKNPFYYIPVDERPLGYELLDEFFNGEEAGGETAGDVAGQGDIEGALGDAGITPDTPEAGDQTTTPPPEDTGEVTPPEQEPQLAHAVTDIKNKKIFVEAQKRALEIKKKYMQKLGEKQQYNVKKDIKKKYTKPNYSLDFFESSSEFKGMVGDVKKSNAEKNKS